MPYCPLNVSELPLKTLEPSPRVVDVKKYVESAPDVYLARRTMAPLDAVVTFLWLKDPRYLQQFLNRRCSLFVCQIKRKDLQDKELVWEITVMRQKMSESLHTIELKIKFFMRGDEMLSIKTVKIHYITDGHILRFEHHDEDGSDVWLVPDFCPTKATSAATLANLNRQDKMILSFAHILMEAECKEVLEPMFKAPEYRFVFDGKWKKPDDLIICPRLRSRGFWPLVDYYQLVYERSIETTKKILEICNIRLLPLWRRCICQAPATRVAIDLLESENVKIKMKKGSARFSMLGGDYEDRM
ncbi:hypothetical protein EAE96_009867 [Botrytis aclada]|nr:hypothetical protein EAE96_009867 [Botrytis aclada]